MAETNRGDFNGDGQLNLADVTILYDAVYDPQYGTYDVPDLNGDNVRDFADLEVMFEDILRTVVGDVYLDGNVSAAELNLVLNHWGQSVDWTLGDFDGSGIVGGGDLDVVLNGWGSNPNPLNTEVLDYAFGYTGRLFDEATGLQNNLNRWYDAKVGRWISEDPISFAGGDANLYRYVGNSPTNWTDPSGLRVAFGGATAEAAGRAREQTSELENSDPAFKKCMEKLRDSENAHVIIARPGIGAANSSSSPHNVNNSQNGTGTGSTIVYDSDTGAAYGPGGAGGNRPPHSNLAHELQHSLDTDEGNLNTENEGRSGVPSSECRAIRTENIVNEKVNKPRGVWNGRIVPKPGGANSPLR